MEKENNRMRLRERLKGRKIKREIERNEGQIKAEKERKRNREVRVR